LRPGLATSDGSRWVIISDRCTQSPPPCLRGRLVLQHEERYRRSARLSTLRCAWSAAALAPHGQARMAAARVDHSPNAPSLPDHRL